MLTVLKNCAGLCVAILLLGSSAALAEDLGGCVERALTDPPRRVIDCGGLLIEAEAFDAEFGALPQQGDAGTSLDISGRAVLVEVEPGTEPFQILTPQAIASVRGTRFVVDASDVKTSVFVARGRVAVTRRDGSGLVELHVGEGVEVVAGEPLVAKRWPEDKVARLFARFGR